MRTFIKILSLVILLFLLACLASNFNFNDLSRRTRASTDLQFEIKQLKERVISLEEELSNQKLLDERVKLNQEALVVSTSDIAEYQPDQLYNEYYVEKHDIEPTSLKRQHYTDGKPSTVKYLAINHLPENKRKRILVTGGAGFVGSHLVDYLMQSGHEVTVVDNFFTGRKVNVLHWIGHPNFEFLHHDVINPLFIEVDEIYHMASPASPKHYMSNPVKTIKTNSVGTINMLGLAKRVGAKILIASSSEIYGDPAVHPQVETYWGNVNTMGPRSCYDEGKRIAEALSYAYNHQENLKVKVARIFNTYGPRMHINDGRVISNFIYQALKNESLTVYGLGLQTRSFQYVSDLVLGLIHLMNSNLTTPVNLGNPDEYKIVDLAKFIQVLIPESTSNLVFASSVQDDPKRRRPDITKAMRDLNWSPKVNLRNGLVRTVAYFRQQI